MSAASGNGVVPKRGYVMMFAAALALAAAAPAFPLGGELDTTWLDQAVVAPGGPAGTLQTDSGRALIQGAASQTFRLAEGLSLSGTAWALVDSLPSSNPTALPPTVLDFSSRVLELELTWEAAPGSLVFEAGKKIIHPSSTFFKAPLDVMIPPSSATGGSSAQSAAAVGKWEEGLVGAAFTWFVGPLSISNFVSPRFSWGSGTQDVFLHFAGGQDDLQDLMRLSARIGDNDIQVLGLYASPLSGSSGDDRYAFGIGIDSTPSDSITLRAEASAFNTTDRLVAIGPGGAGGWKSETVSWAPRAVLGATWANADELSIMAEYYYNGRGHSGSSYGDTIDYAQARAPGSTGPDILGQFGSFETAMHYGFLRASGKLDENMQAEAWLMTNIQDAGGLYGTDISYTRPTWAIQISLLGSWGARNSEAALEFPLWRSGVEVDLFY